MPIYKLNTHGVGSLTSFKEEARKLQKLAGVDAASCMEIVECPIVDSRHLTPSDVFLEHIARRQFPTPPKNRLHDERDHFGIVVAIHPKIVDLLALYAALGLEDFKAGRKAEAEVKTDVLDETLLSSIGHLFTVLRETASHGSKIYIGTRAISHDDEKVLLALERVHQSKVWAG